MHKATKKLLCTILLASLSGCVTTQGGSGGTPLDLLKQFNPFDTSNSELQQLVDAGKYDEAELFFQTNFEKSFSKNKEQPAAVKKLGTHLFDDTMKAKAASLQAALAAITSTTDASAWVEQRRLIEEATQFITKYTGDELMKASKAGTAEIDALNGAFEKLRSQSERDRTAAMVSLTDALASGTTTSFAYLFGTRFETIQLQRSPEVQKRVSELLSAPVADRTQLLSRLDGVISVATRTEAINEPIVADAKKRILADNYISLAELAEIGSLCAAHGDIAKAAFAGSVKVGYVDLTATSFRDRNIFDFELEFTKDYVVDMVDASADFMNGNLSGYDYVFVTDLSAAKIYREFKNKRTQGSKVKTGTQAVQNPDYITTMNEYQTAVANMQQQKIQNAISSGKPCYGAAWVCALGGALNGLAEGVSTNRAQELSQKLAHTPQTLNEPVYSPYNYELVDISAAKVARVDYYVIDVKKKQIRSSNFELKDQEKFTVAYNVEDNDPDKSSIISNNLKEDDVTAWEKRAKKVSLASLFDPKNLSTAQAKPFASPEAMLKGLSARKYASAAPVYTGDKTANAATKGEIKASQHDASTIADERFDSVVLIKTSKATGTGFYVTPDMVLTAYHVVDGTNLVEMSYFNGTKTFGKVVDHDVRLDLALIKAQQTGKPVKIYSGPIRLGETVEAIGHPKGYEFSITRGVISALRKQKGVSGIGGNALIEFVQTDTPISPGNSGGPLFLKDAVVGVNDWVRVDKAAQNLNFSVSFNEIREYLNRFNGGERP